MIKIMLISELVFKKVDQPGDMATEAENNCYQFIRCRSCLMCSVWWRLCQA